MTRRKTINLTGISRIQGIPYFDAWVGFICLNCKELNNINIGDNLIDPKTAYDNSIWECSKCGYLHSKESDLPFELWEEENRLSESITAQRFWEAFFRIATEHSESYWKQCNVCGRVLPFNAFSKHTGWGPLERQMECRSCKGAINAVLNPKRTKQQLHESSVRRRIADLLVEGENDFVDIKGLFKRFESKCFKTGINLDIDKRGTWDIDHILPSKWLYPLNKKNAALLSKNANNTKHNKWPSEFYTNNELIELAKITGADLGLISSKSPLINTHIDVNKCVERFLQVREKSHLPKRIDELKKILSDYELISKLSKG
ncbi:MAG: hypothetical protein K8I03_05250, partial [Ignavibacteria bacterium]|nr:hypothetical protein [Ignavibacteria bacterium]